MMAKHGLRGVARHNGVVTEQLPEGRWTRHRREPGVQPPAAPGDA